MFCSSSLSIHHDRDDAKTADDWAIILELADRWMFSSIRELALSQVEKLGGPADWIVAGQRYNIDRLSHRGLYDICRRESPLTEKEGLKLGIERTVSIAAARQDANLRSLMVVDALISKLKTRFPRCFMDGKERLKSTQMEVLRLKDGGGMNVKVPGHIILK